MNTRVISTAARPWEPHPYQARAVSHLVGHYSAGLPLQPGAGKTAIVLKSFDVLRREHKARTMLVVAPLRVARQVWRQEGSKWADFAHLRFAVVHGDEKARRKALQSGADVYLTNYENLVWLAKQYAGRPLPFDVVVFDELTKMKNSQAERHKAIRPRLAGVRYRWGLTGSLFAKGHMDIFGQQLILDDGAALGRFVTHYRDTYFTVGYNGFDYALLPGAEKRIVAKLAPYWFYMDPQDYQQLPPLIDVPHIGELEPQQRNLYERMKRDALISIGASTITAANAGAVYSKLAQLANGAIYTDGHTTTAQFEKVHDLKLDMLEELLDELDGEPLLVAYEFQSDMHRIEERFAKRFGGHVPYLGAGTTPRQESDWVLAWNRRELPLLCAHPQSAGHGLNMQEGQAYNVAQFSVTWDWELYDQFIRRVRRSGNEQARIFNHLLIIRGTIDEEKLASISDKDFTERRLMAALNDQILAETQGTTRERSDMVAKLSRPAEAQQQAQQGGGGAPTGWGGGQPQQEQRQEPQGGQGGAPAGWGQAAGPDATAGQRERIQNQIDPGRSDQAKSAFSGGVAGQVDQVAKQDYGATGGDPTKTPAGWGSTNQQAEQQAAEPAKAKRTRTTKAEAAPAVDTDALYDVALIGARAQVLSAIIASDPAATVEDILDAARELCAFLTE